MNSSATRRQFLQTASAAALTATVPWAGADEPRPRVDLARQLGVTTGSFVKHLSKTRAEGKLRLLDLPKIMRDDLDLKVIDLMTATIPSWEPGYLDELKGKAAEAGCVITNLKMNCLVENKLNWRIALTPEGVGEDSQGGFDE